MLDDTRSERTIPAMHCPADCEVLFYLRMVSVKLLTVTRLNDRNKMIEAFVDAIQRVVHPTFLLHLSKMKGMRAFLMGCIFVFKQKQYHMYCLFW